MMTDTEKAAKMKQQYLCSWQIILTHLLEWNDADADQWLQSAQETWDLDSHDSWIFHESPFTWIVETIITRSLPDLSESEYRNVERQILRLMDTPAQDFTQVTDWDTERRKLWSVLTSYLPPKALASERAAIKQDAVLARD